MPIPSSADRYESHVDRLIRESIERGDFDEVSGEGKPIPGVGSVDDELWWVRGWLRRNRETGQAPSNPS